MSVYRRQCFAKINLSLAILGHCSGADMHFIDSVIAKISLADTLTVEFVSGQELMLSFTAEPPCIMESQINPTDNTLTLAFDELKALTGGELPGMRVQLIKRIPIASGLGGGSSDAAGFLKLIRELAHSDARPKGELEAIARLSDGDWLELASRIGADVPALFIDGPVRVRGFGERVEPIDLPGLGRFQCAVFHPGVSLSTREMYRRVTRYSPSSHTEEFVLEWQQRGLESAFALARNDFTDIARFASKEVAETLDRLHGSFPLVALTGSGNCIIAVGKAKALRDAGLKPYRFVTESIPAD